MVDGEPVSYSGKEVPGLPHGCWYEFATVGMKKVKYSTGMLVKLKSKHSRMALGVDSPFFLIVALGIDTSAAKTAIKEKHAAFLAVMPGSFTLRPELQCLLKVAILDLSPVSLAPSTAEHKTILHSMLASPQELYSEDRLAKELQQAKQEQREQEQQARAEADRHRRSEETRRVNRSSPGQSRSKGNDGRSSKNTGDTPQQEAEREQDNTRNADSGQLMEWLQQTSNQLQQLHGQVQELKSENLQLQRRNPLADVRQGDARTRPSRADTRR